MFSKQLSLMRNPSFRYFTLSCALAMFGNGLTYIIMIWVLMHFDTSVVSTAILMACFWLPNVLFGPFLGVLADRSNRKYMLILTVSLRAASLFCFAFIAYFNQISPFAIYILATILGTLLAAYIPTALTFVRELVCEKDELLYANALIDTAYEIGAVLGMGGAGLILATTSFATCFMINAFCYLLSTILLWKINYKPAQHFNPFKETFFQQLIEGGRYISKRVPLLIIYFVQGLFFICYMTAPVLLAPFAKLVLHSSVAQFGWLEAALSAGIVVGGFLSPWLAEVYSLVRVIFTQVIIGIIAFYLFSHTENVNLAILYHFFIGFAFSSWALLTTLAQELTDINYQGRIQSLFNSVSGLIIVLFYYLLAQWKDLPVTSLYVGEICILILAGFLLVIMIYNNRRLKARSPDLLDEDPVLN
ncbi:MAG: MFS transporter [Tatlockia sp.]|nr:MFS transporter [Tatlockia sp.]